MKRLEPRKEVLTGDMDLNMWGLIIGEPESWLSMLLINLCMQLHDIDGSFRGYSEYFYIFCCCVRSVLLVLFQPKWSRGPFLFLQCHPIEYSTRWREKLDWGGLVITWGFSQMLQVPSSAWSSKIFVPWAPGDLAMSLVFSSENVSRQTMSFLCRSFKASLQITTPPFSASADRRQEPSSAKVPEWA